MFWGRFVPLGSLNGLRRAMGKSPAVSNARLSSRVAPLAVMPPTTLHVAGRGRPAVVPPHRAGAGPTWPPGKPGAIIARAATLSSKFRQTWDETGTGGGGR